MKKTLQLEEWMQMGIAIFLLTQLSLPLHWGWWILLFFAPDISMIGYAAGNRTGALLYNLFHHKGIALAIGLAGWYYDHKILLSAGLIMFAHSAFDRAMGYGLKYETGFKFTHLGELSAGKPASRK